VGWVGSKAISIHQLNKMFLGVQMLLVYVGAIYLSLDCARSRLHQLGNPKNEKVRQTYGAQLKVGHCVSQPTHAAFLILDPQAACP
jgi:hypothetical protein